LQVAGGVRLWLFVQDIARLQDAYPRTWETFFTNTDVLQAFGASNDKTTSDYLSWLTGETTIFVESENPVSSKTCTPHPRRGVAVVSKRTYARNDFG
jgi:type IV secretory pathway TraG/TraD family ATPase VirD4